MGQLALAAKITHVPSMYLSELDGPQKGTRQAAIDGHHEIDRRCRALGVDTIVVFDTHWLVNSAYHLNNAAHFKGVYTSNELPHFISNMAYEYDGNPALGNVLSKACNDAGVLTLAHEHTTLALEYGTLVPMRYMNADRHYKVISVSALCTRWLTVRAWVGPCDAQSSSITRARWPFLPVDRCRTGLPKMVWRQTTPIKFGALF